eukprot:scaffold3301_cov127-Alexandrium_tamarense.AAC.4
MGASYVLPKDFASSRVEGAKFLCRGAGTALRERYDFDNLLQQEMSKSYLRRMISKAPNCTKVYLR